MPRTHRPPTPPVPCSFMPPTVLRRGPLIAIAALLLGIFGLMPATGGDTGPPAAVAQQPIVVTGTLFAEWHDTFAPAHPPDERLVLVDEVSGEELRILVGPRATTKEEGLWDLVGQRVVVQGVERRDPRVPATRPVVEAFTLRGAPAAVPLIRRSRLAGTQAVAGVQGYAVLMCRYTDSPAASNLNNLSWYTGLTDLLEPYWDEASYGEVDVEITGVYGWYDLDGPRSDYVQTVNGTEQTTGADEILEECAEAARADGVRFHDLGGSPVTHVRGVIVMMSDKLHDWTSFATWKLRSQLGDAPPGWASQWARVAYIAEPHQPLFFVLAHEVGHTLNLPHSSGPHGDVGGFDDPYDSDWDVMSSGGQLGTTSSTYGGLPVHPIAWQKWKKGGWIDDARVHHAKRESDQTITLERVAQPGGGDSSFLMARIPLPNCSEESYTVEARRSVGSYDSSANLPASAVVLHQVDPDRGGGGSSEDTPAQVVDDDGSNPNDANARWNVGETFVDSANDIEVEVLATAGTGYQVRVKRNEPNPPPVADAGPDQQSDEGDEVRLSAINSNDPNRCPGDTLDYAWTFPVPPAIVRTAVGLAGKATFPQDGSYSVTVCATDVDDKTDCDDAMVTVANVPPAVAAGGDATMDEGATFSRTSVTFEDPGHDWPWQPSVSYGEGAGFQPLPAVGQMDPKTLSLDNLYDDGAEPWTDYAVTVRVEDDDEFGQDGFKVRVRNVEPSIVGDIQLVPDAPVIPVGTVVQASAAFADPAGSVDAPYTASWDRNGASMGGTANGTVTDPVNPPPIPDQGTVTGSWTYTEVGSFELSLTVDDKDGGSGKATRPVVVDLTPDTPGVVSTTSYLTFLTLTGALPGSLGPADHAWRTGTGPADRHWLYADASGEWLFAFPGRPQVYASYHNGQTASAQGPFLAVAVPAERFRSWFWCGIPIYQGMKKVGFGCHPDYGPAGAMHPWVSARIVESEPAVTAILAEAFGP